MLIYIAHILRSECKIDFIHFLVLHIDAAVRGSAYFGQGNDSILLRAVACVGNESKLVDCQYTANHNCSHLQDVGVVCNRTCKKQS